jgi:hypothetical protein
VAGSRPAGTDTGHRSDATLPADWQIELVADAADVAPEPACIAFLVTPGVLDQLRVRNGLAFIVRPA